MISIRPAADSDIDSIIELFENTVRHINSKDYSENQIEAWASAKDKTIWAKKVNDQYFFVAEIFDEIVGFSSIEENGYLDFMYVHKDFQNKGIASTLLSQILVQATKSGIKRIFSSISVTAKPFFLANGFQVYDTEHKSLNGIAFTNSLMEKLV